MSDYTINPNHHFEIGKRTSEVKIDDEMWEDTSVVVSEMDENGDEVREIATFYDETDAQEFIRCFNLVHEA